MTAGIAREQLKSIVERIERLSEEKQALADYLLDHYGDCVFPGCPCRKLGWLGRLCPHWRPLGARSWDELREAQKHLRHAGGVR